MIPIDSKKLILFGFLMVLAGAVLPFLIVIKVLESTFFLNFFSFAVSVIGLFIGQLGIVAEIKARKDKQKEEDY